MLLARRKLDVRVVAPTAKAKRTTKGCVNVEGLPKWTNVNSVVPVLGFSQRELRWALQAVPTPSNGARLAQQKSGDRVAGP